MESRGIKRKRYEDMKNDLSVQLHQLTIDSGKYTTEVQSVSEDLHQMLKALSDRQGELLTKGLLLQEQYSTTLDVLDKEKQDLVGEGSVRNVALPATYENDVNRLAVDSNTSLKGHIAVVKKEFEDMENNLEESGHILKQNMEELKNRSTLLDNERAKLSAALNKFVRYLPEDSDQEDEEDEED